MNKVLTISGVSLEVGNPKYMSKAYNNFLNETATNLSDVYEKCSVEKIEAYENCRKIFEKLGGEGFTIVSYNGWIFCVGFRCYIGNEKYFCYITPSHKRICEVKKLIWAKFIKIV